jgi:hypothetical protein
MAGCGFTSRTLFSSQDRGDAVWLAVVEDGGNHANFTNEMFASVAVNNAGS